MFLVEIAVGIFPGTRVPERCPGARRLGASGKFLARSGLQEKVALVTVSVLFLPSHRVGFSGCCVFPVGAKNGIQLLVVS